MNISYISNNLYSAFNNDKEAHGLSGDSIFDVYSKANSHIPENFEFSNFCLVDKNYKAEWNSDLDGFVIIFNDGKCANTQTYTESNRLHADFGETYIERYTEYDDKLSTEQDEIVNDFIEQINRIAYHFS